MGRTIAVVAYEMEGERTGVGRYLEGLLGGVARRGGDDRWLLFFKGERFEHPLWSGDATGDARFEPIFDGRPGARPIVWEQLRLPRLLRRARPDLVFSPAYSLPASRAPGMVTIHDLSFELLPDEFPWQERWRRRLLARRAVRRARRVLTDAAETARDLRRLYGVEQTHVGVVPLGIDEKFLDAAVDDATKTADEQRLATLGIRFPYLLYVGSFLDRRRLDLVIAAFAALAPDHPALELVLAGRNRLRRPAELERWIEASGAAARIRVAGYVPEAALVSLYRRATLSFYLSTYEGYGLPPLESLAVGTPAVVSGVPALDALWPDYPFRCRVLDARTVRRVTRTALEDVDERREVARAGRERMRRLDWDHAAGLFLAEVGKALAR